ncbi:MAG: hypothetical protein IIW99_01875 [Treponema sp.]|nr:hypothetical protein [Treponema sp.]
MEREHFKSRLGFILMSAGCAIGCGNVWKFPWMVGKNGGGIFLFLYVFFSMIIGIKNCVERIIKYMMMLLFIVMISVATCASRQGAVPKVMTATLNVVVSINSTTVMQTYWTTSTCECFCQPLSSFSYFHN